MKNSQIHSGLENSELRNFLSISLVKNFQEESENKKEYPIIKDTLDWCIADCENDIIHYTKKLELLKEKKAIITLIKMQGWKEFDVSEETEKDLHYKLKMNFIGTDSEYVNLIQTIIQNKI